MQVSKNESKQKQLWNGVGLFKTLKFNPTLSEYQEIMNFEPREGDKEFEYLSKKEVKWMENGEEKTGEFDQLKITALLEEQKTKQKFSVTFFLVNKERVNKDGTKAQYCNCVGQTTWSESENLLPSWFCEFSNKEKTESYPKEYRPSIIGEENIYSFLAAWLNLDTFYKDNNILLDLKKLFKSNTSELNNLISDYEEYYTMALSTVKVKDVEEEGETTTKEYQVINNKFFCSGRSMKNFRNYASKNFEGLAQDKKCYNLNKMIQNILDSEHGEKNFYGVKLQEIHEYDSSANPLTSDSAVLNESNPADSSY